MNTPKSGENDNPPLFSRCSIGKSRWYWVVGCDLDYESGYTPPLAEGISDSPESALKAAEEQFGTVRDDAPWVAKGYRRMKSAKSRMERPTVSKTTAVNEYAYRCGDGFTFPHRIAKRTKKYIYVECETSLYSPYGDWQDYARKTFRLDRDTFERTGAASRGGGSYETYYADPSLYLAETSLAVLPSCLHVLQVSRDSSPAELKAAYRRLANKAHPDVGGDPEEFKKIQTAYEDALTICGQ